MFSDDFILSAKRKVGLDEEKTLTSLPFSGGSRAVGDLGTGLHGIYPVIHTHTWDQAASKGEYVVSLSVGLTTTQSLFLVCARITGSQELNRCPQILCF